MSKNAIELKGSILSLTVLKIYSDDIETAKKELGSKVSQAPEFFVGIPIVIEPQVLLSDPTFLALMVEYLHQLEMIPIGIRTDNETMRTQAEYSGLAVFPPESKKKKEKPVQAETGLVTAKMVEGSVRSGQQVYAKERDIIVMGSVNPGAEVIADGNVHVFGSILGKVFAGSSGAESAKIFAKHLNPELVCIAGLYQLSEDINDDCKQGFVEISLSNEKLIFNKVLQD